MDIVSYLTKKGLTKEIESITEFPASGTFKAVAKAKHFAKKNGFKIGSMCSDEPIALAKNVDYIAKWYNIASDEKNKIEGVLISEDFREGAVQVIIFK